MLQMPQVRVKNRNLTAADRKTLKLHARRNKVNLSTCNVLFDRSWSDYDPCA